MASERDARSGGRSLEGTRFYIAIGLSVVLIEIALILLLF